MKIIQRIKQELDAPCLYNVDVGGPVSALKASEMKSLGIDIAIHPSLARGVFGFAMHAALEHLQEKQLLGSYTDHMFTSSQYNQVLGLDDVQKWEEQIISTKK